MARSDTAPPRNADPLAFETVQRGRVYEQVLKQLQEQIASGRLKSGDRLPPERELADRFKVSRSSVRDAIQALQVMGLVRSRQGEGTLVCEISADSLAGPLSRALADRQGLIAELIEARKILEPPLAARAAANATPEEVARLEEILGRQEEKMRRSEPILEEDSDFHYTIALAARNSVVRRMVDLLMDLLRESRSRGMQRPGRPARSLAGHRRVLAAIRAHDPRAAAAAMLRHIREIERILMKVDPQP
ncbi:MAG TPA: FadR/GntR family transcriptional regulator [Myxococcales bacterium]|nr:FadR/GntR family transcriptional regulator [Myxococcales bacterium]